MLCIQTVSNYPSVELAVALAKGKKSKQEGEGKGEAGRMQGRAGQGRQISNTNHHKISRVGASLGNRLL